MKKSGTYMGIASDSHNISVIREDKSIFGSTFDRDIVLFIFPSL